MKVQAWAKRNGELHDLCLMLLSALRDHYHAHTGGDTRDMTLSLSEMQDLLLRAEKVLADIPNKNPDNYGKGMSFV